MRTLKFLMALTFIWPFFGCLAQSKQQDVQQLILAIHIKPNMQNLVWHGITLFQKKKPAVPQQVWEEIKNSVDYSPYMERVFAIFNTNYSQAEVQGLIKEANANPKKLPLFKQNVQQQLYNAGNEFGKNFANLISIKLKEHGY